MLEHIRKISMLQVKTTALVLDKESGYNDEGKIFLFTRRFGLLKVVASGVYKPGASLSAWTEPPVRVTAEITLREESFEFGRLLTLSPRNFFYHIRSSYGNMSWCYFYTTVLSNFLPFGVKSEKMFRLLGEVLDYQPSWESAEKRDLNFAYFLIKFLETEGICSGFGHCIVCGKDFGQNETAYFASGEQGLLCESCSREIARQKAQALGQNFLSDNTSLSFLTALPQGKNLRLPGGLLRIKPEERAVLAACEKGGDLKTVYANIFSRPKINDQVLAKARNFLLIFLAPLL